MSSATVLKRTDSKPPKSLKILSQFNDFSVVIPDQCEEDEEGGMQTSSSVFSVTGFLTFSVVAAQVFVNIINVISEPYFCTYTCICIKFFLQINQKLIDFFNISDILFNSTKLL